MPSPFGKRLRRRVRRHLVLGMVSAMNRLPRRYARACGRCMAWWFMLTRPSERQDAVGRAELALRWAPGRCDALVRRCALTFGEYAADAIRLERFTQDEIRELVRVDGLHSLLGALENGRGAIVLGAHIGNWELLAAALGSTGVPLAVLARRPSDVALAMRLERLRARFGVETIWRESGGRSVLRALRDGKAVGMLIDQATDTVGGYVHFFGRPAFTPTGPARIAIRTGVPVVPARMRDLPDGSYNAVIEPALEALPTTDELEMTAAWTCHVEAWVREAPHTWVWMHDRWRQPAGSAGHGVVARDSR
jgi:Kdo2-lipid IVA lauroyltransferase/acyltransferase